MIVKGITEVIKTSSDSSHNLSKNQNSEIDLFNEELMRAVKKVGGDKHKRAELVVSPDYMEYYKSEKRI